MTDKNNDLDIPIYEIKSSETIRKSMIKSDNSTTTTINAAPAFNSPILHSPTDISTLTADPPSSILLSEPLRRVKSLSPVRVVSIKTPGVINQISSKISSLINTSAPDIPNSTPELTPLTAIIDKSPKIMNQNDIDIVKRKARMNASIIRKQEQDYVQRPVKNTKFKNFKEWHAPFLAESKQYIDVIKKSRLEDRELGEFITLSDLFGDYKNPFSASAYMIWAARNLEKLKTDVTWNIKRSAPVFIRGKKVIKTGNDDDSDDDDDIKYRLLNIFEDKRIERVVYSWNESGHDIVQNGRPLDLIDAMIFPLVQDYEFPKVFLSSFRMYIPARRVVEALIEWYNVDIDDSANTVEEQFLKKNKRSIQCRVIRILVLWINSYWQDFVGDNSLYCELMRFVIDAAAVSFGDAEKLSQSIREQVINSLLNLINHFLYRDLRGILFCIYNLFHKRNLLFQMKCRNHTLFFGKQMNLLYN